MNDQYAGRPVMAGVDGSESALDAVRWAAREAAGRRVLLRLVATVGRLATVHQYGDPVGGPDEQQMLLRLSRAHLAAAEQAAVEAVPGIVTAAGDVVGPAAGVSVFGASTSRAVEQATRTSVRRTGMATATSRRMELLSLPRCAQPRQEDARQPAHRAAPSAAGTPSSSSRSRTRASISSRIGLTASTPLPAGSGSCQSR
jgi:hypothetical protein